MKKYKLRKDKDSFKEMFKSLIDNSPIEDYIVPSLIIRSNKEIVLSNYISIQVYTENTLKIKLKEFYLVVEGANLVLDNLTKGNLNISGEIFTIKYIYEE